MQSDFEKKSRYFKALSEPVRLKILDYLLKRRECSCICHLSKALNKHESVILRHIQQLKSAGIVNTRKNERFLFCCVGDKDKIKRLLEE
ncbi:winged helix-turn-helix transcriptional regulator [Candidatus Woesearchaeota archaeon]|nr:winged helix-turn-helix transcriptional regulator [Candidatus Woesearchaeota archaeon]